MQSLAEMVNPGGTGRPRFAISARPAPLPPRMSRIAAEPSARPSPNEYTHRSSAGTADQLGMAARDRKSTRLNSSHDQISYAVFCLKKKRDCRVRAGPG